MKKHYLLAAFIFLCGIEELSAQRFTPQVSLFAGVATGTFKNKYYEKYNTYKSNNLKPSVYAALNVHNKHKSDFYFSVGFQYASFAYNFENVYSNAVPYDNHFVTRESKTTLQYLQVPLLVGYAFKIKSIRPFVGIGITPAFLLSYDYTSILGLPLGFTYNEHINQKEIAAVDMGHTIDYAVPLERGNRLYKGVNTFVNAELGLEYCVNRSWSLTLRAYYQKGLSTIENLSFQSSGYMRRSSYYASKNSSTEDVNVIISGNSMYMIQKNNFNTFINSAGIQLGFNFNL